MDNMIRMLERYSNNLEEIVGERTQQVEEEKKKSETLLYRMLPRFKVLLVCRTLLKVLLVVMVHKV